MLPTVLRHKKVPTESLLARPESRALLKCLDWFSMEDVLSGQFGLSSGSVHKGLCHQVNGSSFAFEIEYTVALFMSYDFFFFFWSLEGGKPYHRITKTSPAF